MLSLYEELHGTTENYAMETLHYGEFATLLASAGNLSGVFSEGIQAIILSFIEIDSYAIPAVDNWLLRLKAFCTSSITQKYFVALIPFRHSGTVSYTPAGCPAWIASLAGSNWKIPSDPDFLPFAVLRNTDYTSTAYPARNFFENTNLHSTTIIDTTLPFTYILTAPRTGTVARVHDKFYPGCVNNGRSTDVATLPSRLRLQEWWHATDADINEDKCIEYLTKRLEDVEAETPTVSVWPAFAPASESATRICPGCKVLLEFSEKAVKPELTTQYKLETTVNAFSTMEGITPNQNDSPPEELLFSLYNAGEKEIWQGTVGTLSLTPGVHPFSLNAALVDGSGIPFALISPGTGLARYNYVAAPAPEDAPTAEIEYADGAELPVALDGVGATPRFNQSERTLSIEIETGFPAFDEPTGTLNRPGGLPSVPLAFTNRAVSVDETVLSADGQYTVTVDAYTNNAGQTMTPVSRSFIIDTVAPTITIDSPAANSTVTNSAVTCHYSEDLSEGTIRWTRTGGTADGGSPHTFTIPSGDLPAAGFDNTTVAGLVIGAVYTLTVNGKDLAGNDAGTASHTNISFEESMPQPVPQVTNITSTTANGNYNAGDHINIQVTFDRAVKVTYPPGSAPTLALNSGGSATYTAGSGTATLTFGYDVASGENTPDLDSASGLALNANGSTIQAADDGQTADLAVPVKPAAGALATNKTIIIDTVVPTINILSPSSNSFVLNSDVTYQFGETLKTATITWTRTDATETLHTKNLSGAELQTGNHDALNTASLTWGGVYTLTVSGEDLAGNAAVPAVHTTVTVGYGQQPPKVTNITSTKTNGSYKKNVIIAIQVTFSRAVTVTYPPGSAPTLALNSGGTATYTGGSGTATLNFTYKVGDNQNTSDLDSSSASALNANGAAIQAVDDAQTANLAVPVNPASGALGVNKTIIIDTKAPMLTAISGIIQESLFPWPFRGKILEVTMVFNEVVSVDTSGTNVELQVPDKPRASYKSGDGTNTLLFSHRFSSATLPYTRTGVTGTEILCVKGYIRDAAGNDAKMIVPPPSICKLAICGKPVACGLSVFCGKPVTCGYKIFDEPDLCLFKIDFCNPKIYPGCMHGIGPNGGDFCPTINPGPFEEFDHRIRDIIEHNDYRGLVKLRTSKEFKKITDALGPAQTKNLVELLDAMAKELKR